MSGYEADSDSDPSSQIPLSDDSSLDTTLMGLDSSIESDPSMDMMISDSDLEDSMDMMISDSEDSSVQIIEPPAPEIIDLVSDDTGDIMGMIDFETDMHPEVTTTPLPTTLVAPVTTSTPVPATVEGEPTVLELLSPFEPTPYPLTHETHTVMDHYHFDTMVSAPVEGPVIPPPISTVPPPVISTPIPPISVPVHAPMTTSFQIDGSIPLPVPTAVGDDVAPYGDYQTMYQPYVQTGGAAMGPDMGIQGPQDPPQLVTGFVARAVESEIMQDIAVSVFQSLRTSIRGLPSTSQGYVDGVTVARMVDGAYLEFLRRVSGIFY
ncbi:uncharacterized protein LOC108198940 [Daucus carota subsp. sativus]|uniref:uncharacterized protein LOC108198940 n=1 Tax=Daucus carota subsp. sativus TaxID=79200 RepID=UPI0030827742